MPAASNDDRNKNEVERRESLTLQVDQRDRNKIESLTLQLDERERDGKSLTLHVYEHKRRPNVVQMFDG